MNLLLFSFTFIFVFALLNIYISKRLIKKLDLKKALKDGFNIFLIINFLGIIGYMLGRYYINIPSWLYFLLSVPIGIIFLLFCATLFYDISLFILFRLPLSRSRRDFFKRSFDISTLGAALVLNVKGMVEARKIEIEKVEVQINHLKSPYKLNQLSDLHIGGVVGESFIREVVEKSNAMNPDLVVITGDLVDIDVKSAALALDALKNLHSRYGIYYIVGNHEYFHGIEKIIEALKLRGIRVLENESVYIGKKDAGFNLAGVYDLFGYRMGSYEPNLSQALAQKVTESPTVLLAHQPKFIYEVKSGVDLMLSGHTHGGQIYPFRFLVALNQPYISGLHQHTKELQIYVSKGTGFWGPPMRLGASSEITCMTLVPTK